MSNKIQTTNNLEEQIAILKKIADAAPQVRIIAGLKDKGYEIVFAPDTSEIINYIAPHNDIKPDADDLPSQFRDWYATIALFEEAQHDNVLLMPYIFEVNAQIKNMKDKGDILDNKISSIKTFLKNNPEFQSLIKKYSNSKKEAIRSKTLDKIITQYADQFSILLELLTYQSELDSWNNLIKSLNLKSIHDKFPHIDPENLFRLSSHWQLKIDSSRYKKQGRKPNIQKISPRSMADGWAIEHVIKANKIAAQKRNKKKYPIMIFVTRSNDIHEVFSNDLEQKVQGWLLNPLWTPSTYLAYHLIMQNPNKDYQDVIDSIDDLYEFIKQNIDNQINDDDYLETLLKSNHYVQQIEQLTNLNFGTKDSDIKINEKLLNLKYYENQKGAVEALIKIAVPEELEKIHKHIISTLNTIWSGFNKLLLRLKIVEIDGRNYASIKYPLIRIWVHFNDPRIYEWISNIDNIYEEAVNIDKVRKELHSENVAENQILLLELILSIYDNPEGLEENIKKIKELKKYYDPHFDKEMVLMELTYGSMLPFGNKEKLIEYIKLANQKENDNLFNSDPRFYKLRASLNYMLWDETKETRYLENAENYDATAYQLVNKWGEFKVDSLNNLAFIKSKVNEQNEEEADYEHLNKLYKELDKRSQKIYPNKIFPEISHTLGVIKRQITIKNPELSNVEKKEELDIAEAHLTQAHEGYQYEKEFLEDLKITKNLIKELEEKIKVNQK